MRLRNGLVAAQVAIAVVVLVGAGLLLQTFRNLSTVDLGYRPAGVLTFFVNLPAARYGEVETRHQFVADTEARLAALPGVAQVGASNALPLAGFDGECMLESLNQPAHDCGSPSLLPCSDGPLFN